MPIRWTENQAPSSWSALETLYRLAPLGNKSAAHL
jgi:hypothetical protein